MQLIVFVLILALVCFAYMLALRSIMIKQKSKYISSGAHDQFWSELD